MKYIIMCGGTYPNWPHPKQLSVIQGETIVERTIRLLRENNVSDIAISSNDPAFDKIGVPVLHHDNQYKEHECGFWTDGLYPMKEPCCYVFGDVVFSPTAIKTIITVKTNDIELFGSARPFSELYLKPWVEPFALKVADQAHLKAAIEETRHLHEVHHAFKRSPLSWELWEVIRKTPLNVTPHNYTVITDYTCDVDEPDDVEQFNTRLRRYL